VPPHEAAGLRVLLVDDSAVSQQVACCMLEALGCEVVAAADGSTAVEQALAGSFDLVLMDCQMPCLDGFEATRRIRTGEAARQRRPVPIVAITGDARPADRARCLAAGMTDFVSKPFTVGNLRGVLEAASGRAAPAAQAGASRVGAGRADGPPVIDVVQLEELRSLGRPQLLQRAILLFLRQASERLDALERALAVVSLVEVAQAAHALKSAALSVGGQRFAAAADDVERLATTGPHEDASNAASRLRPEFARLRRELAEQLATGERVA